MNVLKAINSMKFNVASLRVSLATVVAIFAFVVVPVASIAQTDSLLEGQNTPQISLPDLTTEALTLKPVTCKISLDRTEIVAGESVTVSWETTGLDEIKINGEVVNGDSGQKTFDNITVNTTFELTSSNNQGGSCKAKVTLSCVPPPVKECKLELYKSVDKTQASPENHLTYTITIENIGDRDCTGGGVKIYDVIDDRLEFVSQNSSDNISPGYGSKSVYTPGEHTLRWNGHDLNPGEKGEITWVGKIKKPDQCGDFEVHNKAKATAKELNNFKDWYYSNKVTTAVSYPCDKPEPPQCPITPADKRIIIDFSDERLRSDRGIDDAQTNIQSFNIPAGQYDIRLVSWDGYIGRESVEQDFEQYQLQFVDGTTEISRSNAISDLDDFVREDTNDEVVNNSFTLASDADGLRAVHAFFGDNSSANSLNPICASLDPIEPEPKEATIIAHKIVCTDEAELPNYGNGGPSITADTATKWVAEHASCSFKAGWQFQWADTSVSNPDNDVVNNPLYGPAGSPWTTFGLTDSNGKVTTKIPASVVKNNSFLWVREVLQDGYIPFTYGPDSQSNADNVSAEMYCHTDVKNFDNFDRVDNLEGDKTYYCVAWNSKIPAPELPSCDSFTANPSTIRLGQSSTLTWETTNATQVSIDNNIGNVPADGSYVVTPTTDTTYTLTVVGDNGKEDKCQVPVKVDDTPERPVCPFTPGGNITVVEFDEKLRSDQSLGNSQTKIEPVSLDAGVYNIRLASWDAYYSRINVTQPNEQWKLEFLSGTTQVALSAAISDLPDKVRSAYLEEKVNDKLPVASAVDGLRAVHAVYRDASSPNSVEPICAEVERVPEPAPSCDSFIASPNNIIVGSTTTLSWETSNATRVVINNGIGEVIEDGSVTVSPLADTVYKLTVFGTEDRKDECEVPVKVSEEPVPVCVAFTATPGNLPIGGGAVELNWEVEDATTVSISPSVGDVGLTGSTSANVTESTTFTLTAVDANGDEVSCVAPVTVPDPVVFTCADNVSFGASPNSVRRGSDVTLTWNVTNADTVVISEIGSTTFSGTATVNPDDDTTYVLTATLGDETIECPTNVTVSTGGGGGGSSSPRCELDISDERISLGDEITLTWDTSRAREVKLTDDEGNVLFDTDDMLSDDKEDFFEGSITLSPTKDTEYTLTAERGSRDRTCRVKVELDDDIVILETRDQQPLVAGISLSAVPYTGFEAGPFMTVLFYALLIAWAFYIAYLVVIRKQMTTPSSNYDVTPKSITNMQSAEQTRPDVFVESVTAPAETQATAVPTNLPSSDTQIGYDSQQVTESIVANIENRAHSQKALLSSDAIRHFVATTEGSVERNEALDEVITEAKKAYPLEDGWIVINESRMKNLCEVCNVNAEKAPETFTPTVVPEGSSSLAEAIVTGNVVAAYEMIGHRPMFALADAAADLDAVYRNRRGENKTVSELLTEESAKLSDEQITRMISALTSALDGTYTSEAEAVKMAIMKAVKEVS